MVKISASSLQALQQYVAQNNMVDDLNMLCEDYGFDSVTSIPQDLYYSFMKELIELRKNNTRLNRLS